MSKLLCKLLGHIPRNINTKNFTADCKRCQRKLRVSYDTAYGVTIIEAVINYLKNRKRVRRKNMKKIYLFKYGICFEKDDGGINAHFNDLFGIGICKSIKHHTLLSMGRFWSSIFSGIKFILTNKDV